MSKSEGKLNSEYSLKGQLNYPVAEEGTDTSDGTIIEQDVLKDKIAYSKGKKIIGTMKDNGNITIEPSIDRTILTEGYYQRVDIKPVTAKVDENIVPQNIKEGVVILNVVGTAVTGVNTSDATATSEDIEEGKTAYVNEEKIIGTTPVINNYSAIDFDVLIDNHDDYLNFSTKNWDKKILNPSTEIKLSKSHTDIANAIELTEDKILNGETILGIAGSATSDGNITADDLISGKIAYSKGEKITGNILNTNNINIPYMRSNGGADDFEFVVNVSGTISGDDKYCIDNTTNINIAISYDKLAQIIGLTADKLKIGETVLGITGE